MILTRENLRTLESKLLHRQFINRKSQWSGTGSTSRQSMWALWCSKWHRDRTFLRVVQVFPCYCHSTIAPYSCSSWYCFWRIHYKDQCVNIAVPVRRLTHNSVTHALSNVSVRKRLVVLAQSVFTLRSSRFRRRVVWYKLCLFLKGKYLEEYMVLNMKMDGKVGRIEN